MYFLGDPAGNEAGPQLSAEGCAGLTWVLGAIRGTHQAVQKGSIDLSNAQAYQTRRCVTWGKAQNLWGLIFSICKILNCESVWSHCCYSLHIVFTSVIMHAKQMPPRTTNTERNSVQSGISPQTSSIFRYDQGTPRALQMFIIMS